MAFRQLIGAKWPGRLILALLSLISLAVLAAALMLGLSAKPDLYAGYQQGSAYFASNNELLSLRLASDERYRLKLALADIAPAIQQATLLYEDRRFYQHFGLDLPAIGRAFWQGVVRGGRRQGASTISMQLARLRFKLDTASIGGKLHQLGYALYLERHYSKNELLEAYFNYAPYGGNIEGVAAASLIYFNKQARELTLPEAIALSVIPQNPNQRSPLTANGQQQLELARARLTRLWRQQPNMAESPQLQSLLDLPLRYRSRSDIPAQAPHFINELHSKGQQQGHFYTSLDLALQQRFEQQLNRYLRRQQAKGINNGSVLLIKRSSAQIQSWLGSADFNNEAIAGQVDGVRAARSPGSALKPFVYALALQQGLIHPQSLLTDLPRRYGSFNPENFDRQFVGPLTATTALINSRNLPAVQLQARLQQPDFYQWLHSAAVPLSQPASHYGLALVLGGMELSMAQLVQLYAMLGNSGRWQPITWQRDLIPEQQQLASDHRSRQLLSPEAAFLTVDMLRQHPGLQNDLLNKLIDSQPVAWKTGTSYAFRDAWAVALTADYVLAVWLGNFDGSSNPNLVGRTAAGPLLFELLALLPADMAENQQLFTASEDLNLKKVALCSRSGDLPNKYCPQTTPGWFIPGVSPIKVSEVHRAVPVYIKSRLRACRHQPGVTELKVFEFWPSEISHAMQQAGIVLAQPPRYQQHCQDNLLLSRQSPAIRSPQAALTYQLGITPEQQKIALQASFDGAVTQAHWFADNRYLGAVTPGETLFWQASAGQVQLTVVDDLGGASSVSIIVSSASALTAVSQQVGGE